LKLIDRSFATSLCFPPHLLHLLRILHNILSNRTAFDGGWKGDYWVICRTPLTVTVFLPSELSRVTVSLPLLSFSVVTVVVTPFTVIFDTLLVEKLLPAPSMGLPKDLEEKVVFSLLSNLEKQRIRRTMRRGIQTP